MADNHSNNKQTLSPSPSPPWSPRPQNLPLPSLDGLTLGRPPGVAPGSYAAWQAAAATYYERQRAASLAASRRIGSNVSAAPSLSGLSTLSSSFQPLSPTLSTSGASVLPAKSSALRLLAPKPSAFGASGSSTGPSSLRPLAPQPSTSGASGLQAPTEGASSPPYEPSPTPEPGQDASSPHKLSPTSGLRRRGSSTQRQSSRDSSVADTGTVRHDRFRTPERNMVGHGETTAGSKLEEPNGKDKHVS